MSGAFPTANKTRHPDDGGDACAPSTLSLAKEPNFSKKEAIDQACRDKDLAALISLADSSGGFLEDGIRRAVCKTTYDNVSE